MTLTGILNSVKTLDEIRHNASHVHMSAYEHPEFFRKFQKTGDDFKLTDIDFEKYNIVGRKGDPYRGEVEEVNLVDGSILTVFRYAAKSLAQISFNIRKNSEGQMIPGIQLFEKIPITEVEYPIVVQIQGGQGVNCHPFKWEKLLLGYFERWAQESGFKACLVKPYECPKTIEINNGTMITNPKHMHYNVTPKRTGYKMWNGVWRKDIPASTDAI